MNYVILIAIGLSIVLIGLMLHEKKHLKLTKIIERRFHRKKIYAVASLLLLLIIVAPIGLVLKHRSDQQKQQSQIVEDYNKAQPNIAQTATLPAYEILTKKNSGTSNLQVIVYTLDTNQEKITNLNKKLIAKFKKDPVKKLQIDYFNDKKVAEVYFSRIMDAKTTTIQRQKLFSHYIATSTTGLPTANNILFMSDKNAIPDQITTNKKETK